MDIQIQGCPSHYKTRNGDWPTETQVAFRSVPRKRDGQGHVDNITSETQGTGIFAASNVACPFPPLRRSFAQHQVQLGSHFAARGFDLEEGFFGVAVLEKEFAEDTQAVTAFFRLAAVRDCKIRSLASQEEDFSRAQDTVGADAGVCGCRRARCSGA